MNRCKKCNKAMVRAGMYDPEGTKALYGGEKQFDKAGNLKEWWVCINPACADGRRNV